MITPIEAIIEEITKNEKMKCTLLTKATQNDKKISYFYKKNIMKTSKIILNNMEFYGFHGVPDAERKVKQLFKISISFDYDFTKAAIKDDLNQTINYVKVYDLCKAELNKEYKLIETIAYTIAHAIKDRFKMTENIEVKISKPQVQMRGKLEDVSVIYYL